MEKNLWLAASMKMRETVQDGDGERMKGLASECFKELAIVTWRRLSGGDRGPKVRLSHKSDASHKIQVTQGNARANVLATRSSHLKTHQNLPTLTFYNFTPIKDIYIKF
jgi:hypothetical protein